MFFKRAKTFTFARRHGRKAEKENKRRCEEVGREIRRPEINTQKSINNAYKRQWERGYKMEQAGRSVANLISKINGAARHAEAKCSNIYALKYFPALKTLALCILCNLRAYV